MQTVKKIAKNFINLFYPLHCLGCAKPIDALNEFRVCSHCAASIKNNAMPPFELEETSVRAYSACLYEGQLKKLVHNFKYQGKTVLSKMFAKLMIDYIKKEDPAILDGIDLITYVPLHKIRLREREFNQSLLLANAVSKEFGLSLKKTLDKIRATKYQNELLKKERLINLKGAFMICDKADIVNHDILLIDDVMTTGATLNECAKTLLDKGAKNVTCFTLARGI